MQDCFEGLLQEEDHQACPGAVRGLAMHVHVLSRARPYSPAASQVPGASTDSLSSNTQLGRAVQSACDELEHLSSLVKPLSDLISARRLRVCCLTHTESAVNLGHGPDVGTAGTRVAGAGADSVKEPWLQGRLVSCR